MKKLLVPLIAGCIAAGAFAQTPATSPSNTTTAAPPVPQAQAAGEAKKEARKATGKTPKKHRATTKEAQKAQ